MSKPVFEKVAVIGAGVMGHSIALVHALGGCDVVICDRSKEALEKADHLTLEAGKTLAESGLHTEAEVLAAHARLSFSTSLAEALKDAEYIVEAIFESVDAKTKLFAQISELAEDDAVFTSNTSYLDIFPLLPDNLKARALIVHWYTPSYVIDLVDVIPAPDVPKPMSDKVMTFLKAQGKTPVRLKKFIPGYIANRIQMAIESEIFHLLDAGIADPEDIDLSIMDGLALRLALFGQFKKIDYTGIRLVRDSHNLGTYVPPTPPTASKALNVLLDEGREGVGSGAGFYDYKDKSAAEYYKDRDLALLALKNTILSSREIDIKP